MYRYIKALAGFVGGVSPWTVVGILTVLHVHMDTTQVVTVAALASPVLGLLATVFAPKNAEAKAADDAAAEDLATRAGDALDVVAQKLAELPQPTPQPPTP
jgi:hypothetical protein